MKKSEVLVMNNLGFLLTTTNTLTAEHAYKLLKAKKIFAKIGESVDERRKDCLKECGLDSEEKQKELSEIEKGAKVADKKMQAALDKFRDMYNMCLDEEADLKEIKAVPYSEWHAFLKENTSVLVDAQKGIRVPFNPGTLEWSFENILWKAPEGEK
jgi:hypothetical protein